MNKQEIELKYIELKTKINIEKEETLTLQGSYLNKVDFVLKTSQDKMIVDYTDGKYITSNIFPKRYEKSTYDYLLNSLLLFGIIKKKPKLLKGQIIKVDLKHQNLKSLKEYLKNRTIKENTSSLKEFNSQTNILDKMIFSSYLYEKKELNIDNIGRYKYMFNIFCYMLGIEKVLDFKIRQNDSRRYQDEIEIQKFKQEYKPYIRDIDDDEALKKILASTLVSKYRRQFREELHKEFNSILKNKMMDVINNYEMKTFDKDNDFIFPEGAHIVPVKYLIQNDRIEEIKNHHNGMLLDPNTHTLFDRLQLKIEGNSIMQEEVEIFKIHHEFLTEKRKKYIKEYNEIDFKTPTQ